VLPLPGDVNGVPVTVVDVVDVVAVLDRQVAAAGTVDVLVPLTGLLVERQRVRGVRHPSAAMAFEDHADRRRGDEAGQ
jgi:hypothetical protein